MAVIPQPWGDYTPEVARAIHWRLHIWWNGRRMYYSLTRSLNQFKESASKMEDVMSVKTQSHHSLQKNLGRLSINGLPFFGDSTRKCFCIIIRSKCKGKPRLSTRFCLSTFQAKCRRNFTAWWTKIQWMTIKLKKKESWYMTTQSQQLLLRPI